MTYGNGDYVQYTYDSQGRVTKETFEDGATVKYFYDRSGELAKTVDSKTGIVTTYFYDLSGRPAGYRESGAKDHSVSYTYDTNNNISAVTEVTSGVTKTTAYTYDDDNRVTSMTADGTTVEYTYDTLGRVTKQVTKNGSTVISTKNTTYATSPSGNATVQVRTHNGLTYYYDNNGNISTVTGGGYTTTYYYDAQNQLIRENNGQTQKTYTWTYDASGNITSRKEYAYTTGELGSIQNNVPYTYNDSQWKDLLSSYGGIAITYDAIGNPLTYNGWTFNWQHGRQLESIDFGTVTWRFTYDANGMRTSRTNGTTTYNYVYDGDKLTQMTKGSTKLTFTYDASGTPLTVTYNGTKYYYKTNLQGDVTDILNSSGAVVVTYVYDAWGRIRSKTGSLIDTLGFDNPLRYRGYVYDVQTEFYYLQSRYYYPIWGRFINGDAYVTTGQGFVGNNMFAYCLNTPVMNIDSTGNYPLQAAVELLYIWLTGNGKDQHFGKWSRMVRVLKKSDTMKALIENAIDIYASTGKSFIANTHEFKADSGEDELYLSTQHYNYEITIIKETRTTGVLWWKHEEERYEADVTVHDKYNFDYFREWQGFGNVMNNLAYAYHILGGGNDYDWYATYTYATKWTDVY